MLPANTVEEVSLKTGSSVKAWSLTAPALHRLLQWLDEGVGSSGESYLELRRRLVAYFDRKNCTNPEDLADETLNRVARRLEEIGKIEIETPLKYCYIIARHVFLENLRERHNYEVLSDARAHQTPAVMSPDNDNDEKMIREKMLDCLEQCADKLGSAQRDLILRYYFGRQQARIENRRAMAQQLGITINALSIRACRIREKLAACVKQCAGSP